MNTLQRSDNFCVVLDPDTKVSDALKELLDRMLVVVTVPEGEQSSYRLLPGNLLNDENLQEEQLKDLASVEPIMKIDSRGDANTKYYPALLLDTRDGFYLVLEPLWTEATPWVTLPSQSAIPYGYVTCCVCGAVMIGSPEGSYYCSNCKPH